MDSSFLILFVGAIIVFPLLAVRVVAARKGRHGPWIYPMWRGSPAFRSDRWNRAVRVATVFGIPGGVLLLIGGLFVLIGSDHSELAWTFYALGLLAMYSRSLVIEFGFAFAEPANPDAPGKEAWEPRLNATPDLRAEN